MKAWGYWFCVHGVINKNTKKEFLTYLVTDRTGHTAVSRKQHKGEGRTRDGLFGDGRGGLMREERCRLWGENQLFIYTNNT